MRKILRELEDEGHGKFWKLPTDFRLTSKGPVHVEPMPADFFGVRSEGRALFIECKDVDQPRLKLGGSPGLSPFQVQTMRWCTVNRLDYYVVWKHREEFAIYISWGSGMDGKSLAWGLGWPIERLRDRLRGSIIGG